jgi:hypothetical protein
MTIGTDRYLLAQQVPLYKSMVFGFWLTYSRGSLIPDCSLLFVRIESICRHLQSRQDTHRWSSCRTFVLALFVALAVSLFSISFSLSIQAALRLQEAEETSPG